MPWYGGRVVAAVAAADPGAEVGAEVSREVGAEVSRRTRWRSWRRISSEVPSYVRPGCVADCCGR